MRRWLFLLILSLGWSTWARSAEPVGKVEMPLSDWQFMQDELDRAKQPKRPNVATCPIRREIEGQFSKGLFHGTLNAEFVVLDNRGHIRVPLLDGSASVGKVLLNGERTSLLREGNMYTLGVDKPGNYKVSVEMFLGKEQDRFARRLRFKLPEAGATHLSVYIPETDIQAKLSHGALVGQHTEAGRTRIEGHLDANGVFDLTWSRRLTHREGEAVRLQAQINSLFTVRESMVTGLAVFDLKVLEGETDRIDLILPPRGDGATIEVLSVEGEAVLQWRTDAEDTSKLTVLLRYLAEDNLRLAVRFQFPTEPDKAIRLRMPLPEKGTELSGAVGVLGPAGLNILVESASDAKQPHLRDLPPALTELTANPLQHGFIFNKPPRIRVRVEPHETLSQQATALVDELQASTVLLEDGAEITKLKLRIRNNARQYLAMQLPAGAILTHSLIDGRPVRPADVGKSKGTSLKFPLRQSDRLSAEGERFHRVRPGETLSDIANFYYSDPGQWSHLLDNNDDQLGDAMDLFAGQRLRIPTKKGVKVEESTFVIELAYKRLPDTRLGWLGSRAMDLPSVDVDVMRVTWHLYFPQALTPLAFESNLTQYTAIRYEPFRRVRDFLRQAFWERNAWASYPYKSILSQRKAIYKADYDNRSSGKAVLATFPLVGQRYRFKRTLMQQETARIAVTYVASWMASPIRWLAFLAAFALAGLMLRSRRKWLHWLIAALGLGLLLWLAHYFLGAHRRILWGMDAAMGLALLKLRGRIWLDGLRQLIRDPWRIAELVRLRNLLFVVGLSFVLWIGLIFPLMLSSFALVIMTLWWHRKSQLARQEVAHV